MTRKYKILTADDDTTNLILVKEILGNKYHVKTTASGIDALEWLKTESFDLVITDRDMPDIDGREFKKRIKDQYPAMPVMLITASFDAGYPDYSEAKGFDAFLPKPLDVDLFLDTIRGLLTRSMPTGANSSNFGT